MEERKMEKNKIEEGDQNENLETFTEKLFDGKVLGECLKKAIRKKLAERLKTEITTLDYLASKETAKKVLNDTQKEALEKAFSKYNLDYKNYVRRENNTYILDLRNVSSEEESLELFHVFARTLGD